MNTRANEGVDEGALGKGGKPSPRYTAFLSYSTAADGRLAPALQKGLQGFARPWHRFRGMRVCRDATGLGVTPALWGAIVASLADSKFFVLLASPGSAASKWVEQEVAWWLTQRSADRLLIVLTDGEIAWDAAARDFEWNRTTALPTVLSRAYAQEPLFLDLRWARDARVLTLRNPAFADAVARLAATLRGLSLDEVIGEDVREHRRRIRLFGWAGVALAGVAVISVVAAVRGGRALRIAGNLVAQGEAAADGAKRREGSRRMAQASMNLPAANRELRILLASEALRLDSNSESESALREALAGDIEADLVLKGPRDREGYARFSPDGTRLVLWGGETARVVDAVSGTPKLELAGHSGDILDARHSRDGRRIATVGGDGSIRLWNAETGREEWRVSHSGATSVVPGPDDSRVVSLAAGQDALLWDVARNATLATVPLSDAVATFGNPAVSFHPAGGQVAVCGRRGVVVLDSGTGDIRLELKGSSGEVRSVQYSPDGNRLVTADGDSGARVWRAGTGECERTLVRTTGSPHAREARYSPDGRWLVTRYADQTLVVWSASDGGEVARITVEGGDKSPGLFEFSPNGSCVLTASLGSASAELWVTATGSRLAGLSGSEGEIRTLAFSPDGRRVLVGRLFAPASGYLCEPCGSIDELLAAAKRRVGRGLTDEERRRFWPVD
ncbi:MAG: PQQ-binding-like beta-propeller repeat protein [Limisphaerales bacterium]